MKRSILALLSVSLYANDIVDVQEVVRRATDAMLADWAAASGTGPFGRNRHKNRKTAETTIADAGPTENR